MLSGIAILSSNHSILIKNQDNASLTEVVKAESKSEKIMHEHGNILITNQVKADAKQNVKSDLKSENQTGMQRMILIINQKMETCGVDMVFRLDCCWCYYADC